MMSPVHALTLGKVMQRVRELEAAASAFPKVSIYILRNYTVEPLLPYLKLTLLEKGLNPTITLGEFGVLESALLDPETATKISSHDLCVVTSELDFLDLNSRSSGWNVEATANRLQGLVDLVTAKVKGLVIFSTFRMPPANAEGFLAPSLGSSKYSQVRKLNQILEGAAQKKSGQVFLTDFNQLLQRFGESNSLDQRGQFMNKTPFKKDFWIGFAEEITKVAAALKGKAKKVLVLDCDNTLWGGVVGEDGLEGIKLHDDSYPGNVYYEFHREVLALVQRGVAVVLCSKNNEADVFEVLEKHPYCLLKRDHLSGWKVNWEHKAQNIKELAETMNLGLDSFVFVDDNPIEINLVKGMIPEVTTIQVPENISEFPGVVTASGLFDTLSISIEDKKRTQMYQAEAQRQQGAATFASREDFLKSLEIVCAIHQINDAEVPRVAQLSQKTNQFNFTTIRMTEEDLRRRIASPDYKVFTCSVQDKFGESGLTGVIILKKGAKDIVIENFFMSCRVLGRDVEFVFVRHVLEQAERSWGLKSFTAEFIKTPKNDLVVNYWDKLGVNPEVTAVGKKYLSSVSQVNFPKHQFIKIVE